MVTPHVDLHIPKLAAVIAAKEEVDVQHELS